ncbi:hypothetical protein MAJ_07624, partial [Metarhizium majus ARSEF 297]
MIPASRPPRGDAGCSSRQVRMGSIRIPTAATPGAEAQNPNCIPSASAPSLFMGPARRRPASNRASHRADTPCNSRHRTIPQTQRERLCSPSARAAIGRGKQRNSHDDGEQPQAQPRHGRPAQGDSAAGPLVAGVPGRVAALPARHVGHEHERDAAERDGQREDVVHERPVRLRGRHAQPAVGKRDHLPAIAEQGDDGLRAPCLSEH